MKKTTKGHNSAKTDNSQNSCLKDHLHTKCDSMWKFKQNPPKIVRGVAFTRFPYIMYSEKTTKGHNSAKTECGQNSCLYDHLHIKVDHL